MPEFNIGNYDTTPLNLRDYILNSGGGVKHIFEETDFPLSSTSDAIQLADNTAYFITQTVDLKGRYIVSGRNSVLYGTSPENCRLKSTGLTGTAIINSEYSTPLFKISFEAELALDLDASGNTNQALDWGNVNFVDCETVGTIKNYDNFIAQTLGMLNSGALTFDGSTGTIGITDTIFNANSLGTSFILPSTATVTRRLRFDKCAFIALPGETALNVSTSASIPAEGYILERVNFAGGGSYTAGVQYDDTKALFNGCRGINNSSTVGQYYFNGNSTATTISTSGAFVKIAGTTSLGSLNERFDSSTVSNRSTYQGALTDNFIINAVLVVEGGNNKEFAVRIAKNGVAIAESESRSTTSGNGRAENVVVQDIVKLETGDYVEVFIANVTDTSDLTSVNLNVISKRIS